MYWNTGDRVVDSILQQVEGFSRWNEASDAESADQLLSGLIHIQEMLPAAVAKHFKLPNLYVAGAHFSRSQNYRSDLISEITASLNAGLEAVANDPTLERDSNPDFSDRPRACSS